MRPRGRGRRPRHSRQESERGVGTDCPDPVLRDLYLESIPSWNDINERGVDVLLPNIQGQRYVFGSVYPGVREGEEFIFTRNERIPVDPTNGTVISVDDQGKYWIQHGTRRTTGGVVCNIFVNEERVNDVGLRQLKSGDRISLEDPDFSEYPGYSRRHDKHRYFLFLVEEEIIEGRTGSGLQITETGNETCTSEGLCFADSPLTNNAILSEIMSYLRVEGLKKARLVCKKWGEEASKQIERRGQVSIFFTLREYEEPETSTKVFRYLHETRGLKMRNLQICFEALRWGDNSNNFHEKPPHPSTGQKILDDLRKLLKSSNNVTSLVLQADIGKESEFLPLSTILQDFGGQLAELTWRGNLQFLPEVLPPFPRMKNLKKLDHYGSLGDAIKQRWVSHFLPLFSQSLKHFTCESEKAELYLQAFLTHGMPKLRGIVIGGGAISKESLRLLLALKNPLTSLELELHCSPQSAEDVRLLERLFLKHSSSLQTLVIRMSQSDEIKFPKFPKLGELRLTYYEAKGVKWEEGRLDYKEHFPCLRKLEITTGMNWSREDPVFNAFFPEDFPGLICKTVRDLNIPVRLRRDDGSDAPLLKEAFQLRMNKITEMFPCAVSMTFFHKHY